MRILLMVMLAAGCSSKSSTANDLATASQDMASAGPPDLAYAMGSGTANGSVMGNMLTVRDAYSYDESYATGGQAVRIAIKLADFTGACGLQQMSDSHKANSQYLKLAVTLQGANDIPTGTYMIGTFANATPPQLNSGDLKQNNAMCVATDESATGGTITIATKTAAGVTGSYALMFGSEMLSGTFDAPNCPGVPGPGPQICAM